MCSEKSSDVYEIQVVFVVNCKKYCNCSFGWIESLGRQWEGVIGFSLAGRCYIQSVEYH